MDDILVTAGRLTLDVDRSTLTVHGRELALTGCERRLMRALMVARGQRVGLEGLFAAVWGNPEDGGPENPNSNIGVIVYRLRRKLEGAGVLNSVLTARGNYGAGDRGYRLNPELLKETA